MSVRLRLFRAETDEELAGTPEFLHMETLRELARLDEGQKLSNARENGIAIGEQRGIAIGEKRGEERGALNVLELLEAGRTPDEIRRPYAAQ